MSGRSRPGGMDYYFGPAQAVDREILVQAID
jgi:hypothetical protein